MNKNLDAFQSELLADLESKVGTRTRSGRPRLVAAVGGGVLTVGVCVAVASTVLAPGPAYAVSTQADGDVIITLTGITDAAGLEAELKKHGITATVNYNAEGDLGVGYIMESTDDNQPAPEPAPSDFAPPLRDEEYWEHMEYLDEQDRLCGGSPGLELTDDAAIITLDGDFVAIQKDLTITASAIGGLNALGVTWTGLDGTDCGSIPIAFSSES